MHHYSILAAALCLVQFSQAGLIGVLDDNGDATYYPQHRPYHHGADGYFLRKSPYGVGLVKIYPTNDWHHNNPPHYKRRHHKYWPAKRIVLIDGADNNDDNKRVTKSGAGADDDDGGDDNDDVNADADGDDNDDGGLEGEDGSELEE